MVQHDGVCADALMTQGLMLGVKGQGEGLPQPVAWLLGEMHVSDWYPLRDDCCRWRRCVG